MLSNFLKNYFEKERVWEREGERVSEREKRERNGLPCECGGCHRAQSQDPEIVT